MLNYEYCLNGSVRLVCVSLIQNVANVSTEITSGLVLRALSHQDDMATVAGNVSKQFILLQCMKVNSLVGSLCGVCNRGVCNQ